MIETGIFCCSILGREVREICKRKFPGLPLIEFDSVLHIDFAALENTLRTFLSETNWDRTLVIIGACHPLIDSILADYDARRLPVQNCVEALLGTDQFTTHLSNGAMFLLEEWIVRWDEIMSRTFGDLEIASEIIGQCHRYFCAVQRVGGEDISREVEEISHKYGLPVKYSEGSLEHLERIMAREIGRIQDLSA